MIQQVGGKQVVGDLSPECQETAGHSCAQQRRERHYFPQDSTESDIEVLQFQTHLCEANSVVSSLKDWKLRHSKMDV
jgi:hypothetical protein